MRHVSWIMGLGLAGCALAQQVRFQAPSTQLTGVSITGLGLQGGSLDLRLDVFNPNSYTLRSTRLQVGVDLENTPFGTAELDRPLELPPAAHSEVRIPLTFTWSGVGAGAKGLLSKGSLNYGLTGRILVETPLGQRAVDLRTNGAVAIADLTR